MHITKGYNRDHRPDLNQVVLEWMVENQAGIPLLIKPLSGNSSDATDFREIIAEQVKQRQEAHDIPYLVADSALYNRETLQELQAGNLTWITRVPHTLREANAVTSGGRLQVPSVAK